MTEYPDDEEVFDCLVSVAGLLETLLERPQPAWLALRLRGTLKRVAGVVDLDAEWIH